MPPKSKWSEKKLRVVQLLMMNPLQRQMEGEPNSIQEIADHVGYSSRYVQTLKANLPELQRELLSFAEEDEEEEETGEDNASLIKQVQDNWLKLSERSPNAGKFLLQQIGAFVEKQEVTHRFSGDYLTRIILAAEHELESEGYSIGRVDAEGVCEVQEEHPLLPVEVWQD